MKIQQTNNQLKFVRYDYSYTVFKGRLVQNYGLVVKAGHSESIAALDQQRTETLCSP